MRGSVAEVLLGEEKQGLAVHLEGAAGDGPQRKLLLGPPQPLSHVFPAPKHWLQAWRWRTEKKSGFGGDGDKMEKKRKEGKMSRVLKKQTGGEAAVVLEAEEGRKKERQEGERGEGGGQGGRRQ